jgi:translocator protein
MGTHAAWHGYAGHGLAVAAVAAVGGAAAATGRGWDDRLDTPAWQPPPAAFGPVWTGLYALVGWAGATVWNAGRGRERTRFATAFGIDLALNASWTWTFFRARRLPVAAAHAAVLTLSASDLIRRARRVSPAGAAALVPYAAWCGFATVLAAEIARRNRGPHGQPIAP